MELNEYKEIKNKRYSPKEVLANLVIASKFVIGIKGESLVIALGEEFIKNVNNKNVLEKLNSDSLEKIINYWSLSIGQAIAYGYIVFNNIIFENKELTEKEITDMFVYTMRLYSPDNAVKFVIEKFRKDNIEIDRWVSNV